MTPDLFEIFSYNRFYCIRFSNFIDLLLKFGCDFFVHFSWYNNEEDPRGGGWLPTPRRFVPSAVRHHPMSNRQFLDDDRETDQAMGWVDSIHLFLFLLLPISLQKEITK